MVNGLAHGPAGRNQCAWAKAIAQGPFASCRLRLINRRTGAGCGTLSDMGRNPSLANRERGCRYISWPSAPHGNLLPPLWAVESGRLAKSIRLVAAHLRFGGDCGRRRSRSVPAVRRACHRVGLHGGVRCSRGGVAFGHVDLPDAFAADHRRRREEYRRIWTATLSVFGAAAIASILFKFDIARGYLAIALPLGLACLFLNRKVARGRVNQLRRRGDFLTSLLVVGAEGAAGALIHSLARNKANGYRVVGVCVPGGGSQASIQVPGVGESPGIRR